MARRHRETEGHGNLERWLLTYSDMITLLMIFFIVLYTLSKVDADKFRALADTLSVSLGGGKPSTMMEGPGPSVFNMDPQEQEIIQIKEYSNDEKDQLRLEDVLSRVQELVEQEGLQARVLLRDEERGVVISFLDSVLFPKGSAELTPQARELVGRVGNLLMQLTNFVRIEGHTDDLPIHTAAFPSNWELSVIRATTVVQALIRDIGYPADRLAAVGYGEYRPLYPNDGEENRSKNRRVDIVILKQVYASAEPQGLEGPPYQPKGNNP